MKTKPFRVDNGMLIQIGDPGEVTWWCEGRPATRAEVKHSIDGGFPHLLKIAEEEGPEAVAELVKYVARSEPLLPL